MRIGTYNLFEFGDTTPAAERRRDLVTAAIRELDVGVLAVQEIGGPADDKPRILDHLAADTGLRCRTDDGQALAISRDYHFATAILWHPRLQPLELARRVGGSRLRHRIAAIVVEYGGRQTVIASYHADPARSHQRIDDAATLTMHLTRGPFDAAVLCGDFNDTSAAMRDGRYLDPDWTTTTPWSDSVVYEAEVEIRDGQRQVRADRRAAETFEIGGLTDAAALVCTPRQATAGHWPTDWSRDRRKDRIYLTNTLTGAVRDLTVNTTETALLASDHLPVTLTLSAATPDTNAPQAITR